ncbi:hypothetical protein HanRHA438_Chr16g0741381 [Helianthus annuus]|uniref:Putative pyruvate/Phosphoenolpyruvate kinase-like domain-containing protein n=1 Tax=Helianthus annuus TaxID=4232 RepID=A0A251RW61_HELAN|nr:putative pyruvate kinase-like domain superfamily [Helianthus annuus]KAJ0441000.1 hypothetical protein HanIR_Chr16g0792831 [Helianthus annuus]KAJ0459064.1 putative pyruvate kinase-like domain superfamily [Helianthus annuus]KAJ0639617.1 putative pyruvate kinase-like domain superfamily [Helianthus annuus]KAJ0643577.1 putative pyruvate kinase-like domain superfamily [Helianthus annuus]
MTKIVGTLGPKSMSVEVLSQCLMAGMSTVFIKKSYNQSILEKAIWWNFLMDQTPHSGFV